MLIKIKGSHPIASSDITDEKIYLERRKFLEKAVQAGLITAAGSLLPLFPTTAAALVTHDGGKILANIKDSSYGQGLKPTAYKHITTYNNFYEFGTSKADPARRAHTLNTRPWSVEVTGECEKPGQYDFEDILKNHTLEERIYRFRCVEAWAMVVPWVGFPLGDLLKRFKPTSKAKYVAFSTLNDPAQMPGQKRRVLGWPYIEGLRMDEAMNPLALIAVGLYGQQLPKQNGAPLRLIVPWKYGFKSIKSIVKIEFTEKQPPTSWNISAGREYGFYSNVNPQVDHPRWSQARERILGASLFTRKRKTLMFNGYAEQVASLYQGMDLRKQF